MVNYHKSKRSLQDFVPPDNGSKAVNVDLMLLYF